MTDFVQGKESQLLEHSESPLNNRMRSVECEILSGGSISSFNGGEVFRIVGGTPVEITDPGHPSAYFQDFTIDNGNAAISNKTSSGISYGDSYSNGNFCEVASRAFSKGTWRFTFGFDADFAVSNWGSTPITLAAGTFKIYVNTATVSQPSYATSGITVNPLNAFLFCSFGGYMPSSSVFSEGFIVSVTPSLKYEYANPKECDELIFTSDCYFNLSIRIAMTSMSETGPSKTSPQNMPGFLNYFSVSAERMD